MKIIPLIILLTLPFATLEASLTRKDIELMTKKNHKPLTYQEVKRILFSTVENINGAVCSVYTPSQCKETHKSLSLNSIQNFKLNIEHTWPQSKGAKEHPANSDMHHLFVASKESNGKRANLPFCNAIYDYWQMDGSILGYDEDSQDCFEPQNNHKGNVARAMFYFSIRYGFKIDEKQEKVFREWNVLDPVDAREVERNKIIESQQGNSNPFITHNHLVDVIEDF